MASIDGNYVITGSLQVTNEADTVICITVTNVGAIALLTASGQPLTATSTAAAMTLSSTGSTLTLQNTAAATAFVLSAAGGVGITAASTQDIALSASGAGGDITATSAAGNVTLSAASGAATYVRILSTSTAVAQGSLYYIDDASGSLVPLAIGGVGEVLTSTGTVPDWQTPSGGTFLGFRATGCDDTILRSVIATTGVPNLVTNWVTSADGSFNTGAAFATGTGLFTAPTTAQYHVDINIMFTHTGSGGSSSVRNLNFCDSTGATVIMQASTEPASAGTLPTNIKMNNVVTLTATEEYGLYLWSTATATGSIVLAGDIQVSWSIVRV